MRSLGKDSEWCKILHGRSTRKTLETPWTVDNLRTRLSYRAGRRTCAKEPTSERERRLDTHWRSLVRFSPDPDLVASHIERE